MNQNESKTGECDEEKLSKKEVLKIAIKARDFEIQMFWQRCYYFLFLNTSVGAAVATVLASDEKRNLISIIPFLCIIGAFVCLAWVKVGLGAKYWQEHWEEIVVDYHRKLGLKIEKDIFSTINTEWRVRKSLKLPYEREQKEAIEKAKKEENGEAFVERKSSLCERFCGLLLFLSLFIPYFSYEEVVARRSSVSRWMHRTACFFLLVWVFAFICFLWNPFSLCKFC